MRALTLRQPWAWAVAHAGKNVENRSFPPPPMWGFDLAIHAGRSTDWQAVAELSNRGYRVPEVLSGGGIVAVAKCIGCFVPHTSDDGGPWHERGQWGWRLGNVRVLTMFVMVRGRQGLWILPPDVERDVRGAISYHQGDQVEVRA
jgi:hypothetical protein